MSSEVDGLTREWLTKREINGEAGDCSEVEGMARREALARHRS